MRTQFIGGLLFFVLSASWVAGGDNSKEKLFAELSVEDLRPMIGNWEAAVNTKDGWQGKLRANITLKRNHPEVSFFHAALALRYDLHYTDKKKKTTVLVSGSEKRAMIPFQKGKQRSLQFMRDFQMQQKEFLLDLLEYRPDDKAGQKALARLRPTEADTAPYALAGGTWTLAMAPVVAEILPKRGKSGPNIDWDSTFVWKKVKAQ